MKTKQVETTVVLASALEPVSIADCWIFETPDERLDAPAYFILPAVL